MYLICNRLIIKTDNTSAIDASTIGKANKIAKEAGSFMFLKDALGSITDITDSSGNLIEHIAYSSFGKISKVTDTAGADKLSDRYFNIPYSYTNREYDNETDLYHYRARVYDHNNGRFLQEDPHTGKATSPKSFISKYIYTNNNPTNYTDPDGEFAWFALALVAISSGIQAESNGGNFINGALAGAAIFTVGYFTGGLGAAGGLGSTASSLLGGLASAATAAYFHNTLRFDNWEKAALFGFLIGYNAGQSGYQNYSVSKGRGLANYKGSKWQQFKNAWKRADGAVNKVKFIINAGVCITVRQNYFHPSCYDGDYTKTIFQKTDESGVFE